MNKTKEQSDSNLEMPTSQKLKNMRRAKTAAEMEYWINLVREEVSGIASEE